MKIRPLVLGLDERKAIYQVIAHAEENPVSLERLEQIKTGKLPPRGDDPAFTRVIPFGYRCVFSLENQKGGTYRHLSVSVLGDGEAPNEKAVEMLAEAFGFRGGLNDMALVWIEPVEPGKIAVNLVQRKDP